MAVYDLDSLTFINGDNTYIVHGGGGGSSGVITVSGTITNTSGSYSGTFNDARISGGMKCLLLELGTPSIFVGLVTVTANNGSITITCDSVTGTSTFTASFIASIASSTEYTALDNAKADKVTNATTGDVATLDSNGNLVDSGKTLGVSVPSDAVFTDTTYSVATQSADGLMSSTDKAKLDGILSLVADAMYPVGAIYTSVVSTSPATLFGIGTWDQINGKFLYACEETGITAGTAGGAKSVSYTPAGTNSGGEVSSHTLTSDQIPSHNHTFTGSAVTSGGQSQGHTHTFTSGTQSAGHTHTTTTGNQSVGHTHTGPSHTHTGPSHTHSVGAHAHGLNSHTHTGPSHTHELPTHTHGLNNHTHTFSASGNNAGISTSGSAKYVGAWKTTAGSGSSWSLFSADSSNSGIQYYLTISGTTGKASGSTALNSAGTNVGTGGTGATGAASGNTANSTAFDSGAAGTGATGAAGTGNTGGISANHTHTGTSGGVSANHTHSGTSDGANQGHTHSVTASGTIGSTGGGKGHSHGFTQPTFTGTAATINTMPPYLAVYMWKRTA